MKSDEHRIFSFLEGVRFVGFHCQNPENQSLSVCLSLSLSPSLRTFVSTLIFFVFFSLSLVRRQMHSRNCSCLAGRSSSDGVPFLQRYVPSFGSPFLFTMFLCLVHGGGPTKRVRCLCILRPREAFTESRVIWSHVRRRPSLGNPLPLQVVLGWGILALFASGPIHTGRATRRACKLERFSFDVTCVQCEHSH